MTGEPHQSPVCNLSEKGTTWQRVYVDTLGEPALRKARDERSSVLFFEKLPQKGRLKPYSASFAAAVLLVRLKELESPAASLFGRLMRGETPGFYFDDHKFQTLKRIPDGAKEKDYEELTIKSVWAEIKSILESAKWTAEVPGRSA